MVQSNWFQSATFQHIGKTVGQIVLFSFVVVAFLAVLIIAVKKCRKMPKQVKGKPSIQLNEEQFKENIEKAKVSSVIGTESIKNPQTQYTNFNDEEFVQRVPKKG